MEGFEVFVVVVLAVLGAWSTHALGMAPALRTMKASGGVGIVALELLWSRARARDVLRRLGDEGKRAARLAVWWDFPFIAFYVTAAGVVAWAVASHADVGRGWPGWSNVAAFGGWAFVVAGMLDLVENAALLALLAGDGDGDPSDLPLVASVVAAAKFALLVIGGLAVVTVALLFVAAA